MTTSEVASITNGLDRCTSLLKNLLEQPYNNEYPNRAVNNVKQKCVNAAETDSSKGPKLNVKKAWNYGGKRQGSLKCKPAQVHKNQGKRKKSFQGTTTTFKENIPSSTPIMTTPVKKGPLQSKKASSISSSQCSVIELLQEYNVSPPRIPGEDKPELDDTLKRKEDEENSVTMVRSLHKPLIHLHQAIQPYNLVSGGAVEKAFNNLLQALSSSPDEVVSATTSNQEPDQLAALQSENAALRRQLASVKQDILNQKRSVQTNEISFEVAALQCKNASLEEKLNEVVADLEKAFKVRQEVQDDNVKLQEENLSLRQEISLKTEELRQSGQLFSSETEQIKQDVGDALHKVELLKNNLNETEEQNFSLLKQTKEKDAEIQRLTELNKGLQASVSRLLNDLNKSPASSPSRDCNVTNVLLRRLDEALSVPLVKPHRNHPSSPKADVFSQSPKVSYSVESSGIWCKNSLPPSPRDAPVLLSKGAVASQPEPTASASSSLFSSTTIAENDFNAGLATLDADIQRLQDSLRIIA